MSLGIEIKIAYPVLDVVSCHGGLGLNVVRSYFFFFLIFYIYLFIQTESDGKIPPHHRRHNPRLRPRRNCRWQPNRMTRFMEGENEYFIIKPSGIWSFSFFFFLNKILGIIGTIT